MVNTEEFRLIQAVIIIVAVLLLPFSNAHIHLAQHHDSDQHFHAAEVHTYHSTTHSDNIAPELSHISDAEHVEVGEDSWLFSLAKVFKAVTFLLLALAFFSPCCTRISDWNCLAALTNSLAGRACKPVGFWIVRSSSFTGGFLPVLGKPP